MSDEDEDIPPRMWSDVLDGFGKVLTRLKNFKFTPFPIRPYTDVLMSNCPDIGYVTFNEDDGYGPVDLHKGVKLLWRWTLQRSH